MKTIARILIGFVAFGPAAGASDQLSPEQARVYQDFIQSLSKLSIRFVSKRTFPFDLSSVPKDAQCIAGLRFKDSRNQRKTHNLSRAELPKSQMRFVDERGEAAILQGMDSRKSTHVSEPASDPGVLAVSEIVFDETRHFAVLKYALLCGVHCNSGAILVLEKTESGWIGTTRRPCSFSPMNQSDPRHCR